MKMTLNRDLTHVSLIGRSVAFKAGVPTHVPPKMVKEVLQIGGVIADEDEAEVTRTMAQINKDEADAASRAPAIKAAVKQLVERNQRGDFTAGGRPNLNVLAKLTGFTVAAQEMEPLWNEVVAEMA